MKKNHLKALIAFCKEETIGLKYINGQGIFSLFKVLSICFFASFVITLAVQANNTMLVKKVFNNTYFFNECDLARKDNLGCIAYIDNLRLNHKNTDLSKLYITDETGKKISVKDFEKKYRIVIYNDKKPVKKVSFTFDKNSSFVTLIPSNFKRKTKEYKLNILKTNEINNKNKAQLIYLINVRKYNKGLNKRQNAFVDYSVSYFFSPFQYKDSYNNINITYFKKGFQFIASCSNRFDGGCLKSKYFVRIEKIKKDTK